MCAGTAAGPAVGQRKRSSGSVHRGCQLCSGLAVLSAPGRSQLPASDPSEGGHGAVVHRVGRETPMHSYGWQQPGIGKQPAN